MTRQILLLAGPAATALMLSAAPASAASFDALDTDRDFNLELEELEVGLQEDGVFDDWDANDDNLLDQDELREVEVEIDIDVNEWDENADGYVDEDEFTTGTFEYFDTNDDQALSEPEFIKVDDEIGDEGF